MYVTECGGAGELGISYGIYRTCKLDFVTRKKSEKNVSYKIK